MCLREQQMVELGRFIKIWSESPQSAPNRQLAAESHASLKRSLHLRKVSGQGRGIGFPECLGLSHHSYLARVLPT